MLKATIDADTFRETIDAVSALVNECRLHVDERGIRTITIDTSNVAMVSLELEAGAFSTYTAEPAELGLDIEKIRAMMSMIGKTDSVALELDDIGKKLKISFGGYEYSITLLDTKTIRKDPNSPNLNLPATISMVVRFPWEAMPTARSPCPTGRRCAVLLSRSRAVRRWRPVIASTSPSTAVILIRLRM